MFIFLPRDALHFLTSFVPFHPRPWLNCTTRISYFIVNLTWQIEGKNLWFTTSEIPAFISEIHVCVTSSPELERRRSIRISGNSRENDSVSSDSCVKDETNSRILENIPILILLTYDKTPSILKTRSDISIPKSPLTLHIPNPFKLLKPLEYFARVDTPRFCRNSTYFHWTLELPWQSKQSVWIVSQLLIP